MQYVIVIEKGRNSYGAYVPDLPGCTAIGDTLEEVKEAIADEIALHIEALQAHGEPVPAPTTKVDFVKAI